VPVTFEKVYKAASDFRCTQVIHLTVVTDQQTPSETGG
jgi:hypothetical protein